MACALNSRRAGSTDRDCFDWGGETLDKGQGEERQGTTDMGARDKSKIKQAVDIGLVPIAIIKRHFSTTDGWLHHAWVATRRATTSINISVEVGGFQVSRRFRGSRLKAQGSWPKAERRKEQGTWTWTTQDAVVRPA